MTMGAYNAVRVGDLEIAIVLAREFRSSAGRPSLTLSQLQAVFGASCLDTAERERIDAALEAAGLHTEPSVLDAHPDEALAFRVTGGGNGNGREAGSGRRRFARAGTAPAVPGEEPAPAAGAPPVAAILAGGLVPVLLTSVAGWRFGLSFVAFTVVAAGFLFSRAEPAALLRDGRTFLLAVAGLCLLSLLGAVALAGAGSSKTNPAAHTAPPKPAPRPLILPPRAATPKATTPNRESRQRTRRQRTPKPPTPATPSTTP